MKLYNNLAWGPAQGSGGSSSLANSYIQYRTAGAAARAMLVAAAAAAVEGRRVDDQRQGRRGHRRRQARDVRPAREAPPPQQPVPANVKLKDAADFVYIGKSFARTDAKAKSNGTATFTQDFKLPGMLTAVVAHPPRFGARVKSFDADSLAGVPGVRYVIEVPNGVAVVGTSFWAAKKGRDALNVVWERQRRVQGVDARDLRRVPARCRRRRASPCATTATSPRPWPRAASGSTPTSCSRISRTRRWSR